MLVFGLACDQVIDHQASFVEHESQMGRWVLDIVVNIHETILCENFGQATGPCWLETGILDCQRFEEMTQIFGLALRLGLVETYRFIISLSPLKVATRLCRGGFRR
jgi:hypothetical protein